MTRESSKLAIGLWTRQRRIAYFFRDLPLTRVRTIAAITAQLEYFVAAVALPARSVAVASTFVLMLVGCRTGIYDPHSLPPRYMAAQVTDMRSLDLSSLAASQQASDIVDTGDVINVTIASGAPKERPATWPLRVTDRGTIAVPLIGDVAVAGMNLRQLEHAIQEASVRRGYYRQPGVSASFQSRHINRVTVIGAVRRQGTYDLDSSKSDLLAAIVAAGGLTEEADRFVEVRGAGNQPRRDSRAEDTALVSHGSSLAGYRPEYENGLERPAERIDLVDVTTEPNRRRFFLEDGAVVNVSVKPERYVHVIGLVRRPNRYKMSYNEDVRVLDAVAMAGGALLSIADRVHVIRNVPGQAQPVVIQVSMREAKRGPKSNIPLAPGDVVSVEETPATFLFGVVQQFMRFSVSGRLL